MFYKFLVFCLLVYIVYILFFKKKSVKNKEKQDSDDVMVPCSVCGTYVSQSEALKKQNMLFCSKECIKKLESRGKK
ncbi:MAG: PP0621 family protein [Campylobacteraceae bacterium]